MQWDIYYIPGIYKCSRTYIISRGYNICPTAFINAAGHPGIYKCNGTYIISRGYNISPATFINAAGHILYPGDIINTAEHIIYPCCIYISLTVFSISPAALTYPPLHLYIPHCIYHITCSIYYIPAAFINAHFLHVLIQMAPHS